VVKELNIPANADGSHKLDKTRSYLAKRRVHMLIALPNLDGSFT
jgi:kynurenine 3-monooxygenase